MDIPAKHLQIMVERSRAYPRNRTATAVAIRHVPTGLMVRRDTYPSLRKNLAEARRILGELLGDHPEES